MRKILLAGIVATVVASGTDAQARGIVLITRGDGFKELGQVPADKAAEVREITGTDTAIGYKYSYFGVFWIDFWTWGGEYCLFKDKNYWPLERGEAARLLGVAESALPKPFLYRFPLGLLLLGGLVLLIPLGLWQSAKERKQAAELLADSRYGGALEILQKERAEGTFAEQRAAAVKELVEFLAGKGVEPTVAAEHAVLLETVHGPKEED